METIAPPSPKYSENEFEIDKNGLLLLSKKIKLGTPYQNITAIIDISGNITWVYDTLFVQEKSSTIQYKGKPNLIMNISQLQEIYLVIKLDFLI